MPIALWVLADLRSELDTDKVRVTRSDTPADLLGGSSIGIGLLGAWVTRLDDVHDDLLREVEPLRGYARQVVSVQAVPATHLSRVRIAV